jgi:predicted Zn-dependent protease with MMP-like domain
VRRAQFEHIVDQAIEHLPPWVLERVDNVHVVVEDWPTRQQDPDGEGILGIYEGVSLLERGDWYSGVMPDRIVIFMGPHLDLGLSPTELRREIRRTVLHEIGHHLGMSEAELEKRGYD